MINFGVLSHQASVLVSMIFAPNIVHCLLRRSGYSNMCHQINHHHKSINLSFQIPTAQERKYFHGSAMTHEGTRCTFPYRIMERYVALPGSAKRSHMRTLLIVIWKKTLHLITYGIFFEIWTSLPKIYRTPLFLGCHNFFDGVRKRLSAMNNRLKPNSEIIVNPTFELAFTKIQNREEVHLCPIEEQYFRHLLNWTS